MNHRRAIAIILTLGVLLLCVGLYAQEKKAPATITIKGQGATMAPVTFNHATHEKLAKCDACHHASKAAMPLKAPQQACTDCHTKAGSEKVTTKLQAAFHNPTAKAGLCIDCHSKQAAAGKKTPKTCNDCHKKAA